MNSKCSYSLEMLNLGQNWWFFVLCDLEIQRMTSKNNRAPLLCYFQPCASFHSHLWIKNWVTIRKRQNWVKIGNFVSHVTLKFDGWAWKTIGHLFYATSSFVHHFIAIRELQSENGLGFDLCDLDLWPLTLTFCMDITSVIGNNSWKFHDDMMMET